MFSQDPGRDPGDGQLTTPIVTLATPSIYHSHHQQQAYPGKYTIQHISSEKHLCFILYREIKIVEPQVAISV